MDIIKTEKREKLRNILLIPIIAAMGIIPLIIYMYEYDPNLYRFDWGYEHDGKYYDLFLHYKVLGMVILGGVMLLALIYMMFKDRYREKFALQLSLILGYSVLVLLSYFNSKHKDYSNDGTLEQFESTWVLLAYVVLMLYTYFAIRDEIDIKKIIGFTSIFVFVELVICVFQFFGHNIFAAEWFNKLVISKRLAETLENTDFNSVSKTIYGTLYNADLVGMYSGVFMPIFIAMAVISNKAWKRILWGIFAFGMLFMSIGSRTLAGTVGIVAGFIVAIVIFCWKYKKARIISVSITMVLVIAGIVFINLPQGVNIKNVILGTEKKTQSLEIKSIVTTPQSVSLNFKKGTVFMEADENFVSFRGKRDSYPVTYNEERALYEVDLPAGYPEVTLSPTMYNDEAGAGFVVYVLHFLDHDWSFTNSFEDGYWYYYNYGGNWAPAYKTEYVEWFNDDAFSGRGRIWNNAIPLLKKHIFIGSGANTFIAEMPHDDYVYREMYGMSGLIDVKAHNWFINLMVEEGVLATLLFIGFYIWYFIQTIILYNKVSLEDNLTWLMMAFFTGTLIYMIICMADDATIVSAPVFWGTLGMGLAINRIVRARYEANKPTHPKTVKKNKIK